MTDTSSLISIIIPVYKVEPYLRQCLDSVLAQTYPHWEAICINDGSPDNCGAILDEYDAKDPRFIVIHQDNQGVSVARNRGLEVMQGKYLTLLDADDWFSPDALECIIVAMENSNADFGKCSILCCLEENSALFQKKQSNYSKNIHYTSHPLCVLDRKYLTPLGAGGSIYLTNNIKQNHLQFLPNAKIGEDLTFNIQYLQNVKTTAYIHTPIYHYRTTSGICHQICSQQTTIPNYQLQSTFALFEIIATSQPSHHLSKEEIMGFKAIQLQSLLLHRIVFNNNILQAKSDHPFYIPFPWKYIFGIIPSSNYIDSLKLIIRFRFPFIDRAKNRILHLLKK